MSENECTDLSSPQSSSEFVDPCKICSKKAHGIHFGVLTCRACAAFFRRSLVSPRRLVCRRGDERCAQRPGPFVCRRCRFVRCKALGMSGENAQFNRDKLSNSIKPSAHVASTSRHDEHSETVVTKPTTKDPRHMKCTCLINVDIRHILSTFIPTAEYPSIENQSELQRFFIGLQRHRRDQSFFPTKIDRFELRDLRPYWVASVKSICEWMMFSDKFSRLPIEEKMTIVKDRAKIFHSLERSTISLDIFGPDRVLNDLVIAFTKDHMIDLKTFKFGLSGISDYSFDCIKEMFKPVMEDIYNRIMVPLAELNLTPLEVTYMLALTAFHVEGLPIADETLIECISIRDQISSDMHCYYSSRLQTNYADRIMKINGIIEAMECNYQKRCQLVELAMIFDFIKLWKCSGKCEEIPQSSPETQC